MAHRSAHPVVPIALLVSGLAALLLLTVPAEDIEQPPGFMVGSRVFLDQSAGGATVS